MKNDPIVEEVWRIKDELSREAGDDIHRLCENIRKWAAEHPGTGPVVGSREELERLLQDAPWLSLNEGAETPKP